MVTFPTDYWAPAIDVTVRRRTDEKPQRRNLTERLAKASLPRDINISTKPNFELPFVDSPLTTETETPFSDAFNKSSPPSAASSVSTTSTFTSHTPTEPKKMTLVQSMQRLFVHESKSPHGSPNSSPKEDREFFSTTPDNKTMLKDILSPRLDFDNGNPPKNLIGFDNGKLSESECLLVKKYGVCEKGCIGKGATAVVRLAHKLDKSDCERTYAVKEFRKRRKNETEKDYFKKLTSEFCISSSLQHINIVRTVDLVFQDENQTWCEIMEYCAGGDLYSAIKAGYMTVTVINCCFKQLLQGVGYLHSMGVAHRDIKPENLLIDDKGHLKITDFGVSDVFRTCWQEATRMSKGLCGSEPYIAPEQFETNKEYDARLVDIWACGIVYYCMIYQGIPFRTATPSDPNYGNYLETRNTGHYEPIEKLPRGCRDLLYRILEPDVSKRITIEKIKEDTWFQTIEVCTDSLNVLIQEHNHISPECLKEIQQNTAIAGGKK
ncbi:hypothetical protein G9A89_021559 [Geosiphon pyriformis]|nr:hypothetical protein G9A89_021559 [Geosiphon pyriformis]